jgi:two-component system OmpR family response regulator
MSPRKQPPAASPSSLAWVGTAVPLPKGMARPLALFEDSDDFLLSPDAFDHGFYVVDLKQRGVPGLDLVRLVRRRSAAGLLALSHAPHAGLAAAFDLGADVVLPATSPADHIAAAIAAVRRRTDQTHSEDVGAHWRLQEDSNTLFTPDGTAIELSPSDLAMLRCFAAADGATVSRADMARGLWGPGAAVMDNALHAALYRLRRRIEQAGQPRSPIHAVSGVGYEFRARLLVA